MLPSSRGGGGCCQLAPAREAAAGRGGSGGGERGGIALVAPRGELGAHGRHVSRPRRGVLGRRAGAHDARTDAGRAKDAHPHHTFIPILALALALALAPDVGLLGRVVR